MPIEFDLVRNDFTLLVKNLQAFLSDAVVLDQIGAVLLDAHRKRFLAQREPGGDAWLPSFAAIREGRSTLFDTGALFNSISLFKKGPAVRSIGVDPNVINPETGERVEVYGLAHQFGIGVPKREFIGFAVGDRALVEALLLRQFRRAA